MLERVKKGNIRGSSYSFSGVEEQFSSTYARTEDWDTAVRICQKEAVNIVALTKPERLYRDSLLVSCWGYLYGKMLAVVRHCLHSAHKAILFCFWLSFWFRLYRIFISRFVNLFIGDAASWSDDTAQSVLLRSRFLHTAPFAPVSNCVLLMLASYCTALTRKDLYGTNYL